MKSSDPSTLLGQLSALLSPTVGLEEVADWVASGRRRPRFHWRSWFRRVRRRPLN